MLADPAAGPATAEATVAERDRRKFVLAASYRMFARFGFGEGAAGHITVRDPEFHDRFWVGPFGRYFGTMKPSDLLLVDHEGAIVEGEGTINRAAFFIHSAVHLERPDVQGVAHAHGLYGKTFASLPRLLAPLTQDSCAFYGRHARFAEFNGVVLDAGYARDLAASLGSHRALILANHGHLTAASTLEAAVWWFVTMERSFQSELLARAADTPVEIPHEAAELTASQHTDSYALLCYQTLQERILHENPDLLAAAPAHR